ncbi:MAG: 16S rRNA (uracil(1498)-N(3))-methyltransferase, partial [Planctomycetaceae bacterium]
MPKSDKDAEKLYRLYAPGLATAGAGAELALPAGEVHHSLHVLRLKVGQRVELFDGIGRVAVGAVAQAGRNEMSVRVDSVTGPLPRQGPQVELAFAVPKGNRLDWLLEKACELGVASLVPVIFE